MVHNDPYFCNRVSNSLVLSISDCGLVPVVVFLAVCCSIGRKIRFMTRDRPSESLIVQVVEICDIVFVNGRRAGSCSIQGRSGGGIIIIGFLDNGLRRYGCCSRCASSLATSAAFYSPFFSFLGHPSSCSRHRTEDWIQLWVLMSSYWV